jgi:sugar-specific transcriptional regulator TrmB
MSETIDKNTDIYEDLKTLGLDRNESSVYLSLLKLGEVGASKIVRDTNFHGQTVYDALYNLEKKNLVRYNLVKGRKRFLAQSPSILIDLVEKQKQTASVVVEKIEKKFSTIDTENIEIIKGRESFVLNEFKLLDEVEDNSELLVFGGTGDSYLNNMSNKANEYEFQRNKRNIRVKYLGSEKQKEYLSKSSEERKLFSHRLLPEIFTGVTNITIHKNKSIAIYLFDETVTVIIIKNKKIVDSYTGFFEGLWGLGKKD